MVSNIILSVLLFFTGIVFTIGIPFFGVKFCRDYKDPEVKPKPFKENILWELVTDYPFWIWVVTFLVVQFFPIQILKCWYPTWWNNHIWISDLSCFLGLITLIFYIVLIKVTDEDGKFSLFSKKSKWYSLKKLLSYLEGVFAWLFIK